MDVIDHVAITVQNVATATKWYTETFECTVEWQDDSWALLAFANCKLALVTPGEHPPHFAVLRQGIQNLGSAKHHRDGTWSVYHCDDDYNFVELLERPAVDSPIISPKLAGELSQTSGVRRGGRPAE